MSERSLKQMLSAIVLAAAMTTASNAVLAGNASGEQAADGQDTNKTNRSDFIDKIEGIHTVQRAELFVSPDFESPILPTEQMIRHAGCTFATRDPSSILRLIGLLRANVRSEARDAPRRPDLSPKFLGWEGLYLTLADGHEISFWFRLHDDGGHPVEGVFRPGSLRLAADPSLPKELYLWGEKTGGAVLAPGTKEEECRRMMKYFDELFKHAQR